MYLKNQKNKFLYCTKIYVALSGLYFLPRFPPRVRSRKSREQHPRL